MRSFQRKSSVLFSIAASALIFASCGDLFETAQKAVTEQASNAVRLLGKIEVDPEAVFSEVNQGMMVIAQAVESNGPTIRAFTGALGDFSLEIPEALRDREFIISLVDASGRAIGPLMNSASQIANNARSVGMTIGENLGSVDFGNISVAANGLAQTASAVAGISSVADLVARVTDEGVPVGLDAHGKGASALLTTATSVRQVNDKDQDGLIDLLDADDDGDGILDDFDPDTATVGLPEHYSVDVGFWLNPSDQDYRMFYQADADLAEYVKGKYILEFWFSVTDDAEANSIAQIALDTRNMPPYVSVLMNGPEQNLVAWSSEGYRMGGEALLSPGKLWKTRLTIAAGQKADLQAGDLFSFRVTKKDGGGELIVSQMLNFVFTNIPLLRGIGTDPANLTDFTALMTAAIANPDAPVPGSGSAPLTIADGSDLTIKFQPPVDDLGLPIRQGDYRISIILYRAGDGPLAQVWNIDPVTWNGNPPVDGDGNGYYNNNHLMLEVPVNQLDWDAGSGTYSLAIPAACFPNQATAQGETVPFAPLRYSVGIVSSIRESQVSFTVFVEK
ncbi:MAG: hypothetical protein A2413_18895 [Treponema sp. RIFOXYC1_FULL_61_9]|nr:MAG: hypothetical protein A2413_18895 [Treponema sp. RIFOXYC1_FULL_61_9]